MTRRLPGSTVQTIAPKRDAELGSKLLYQLRLTTRDGREHTLAKGIRELDIAEALCEEMKGFLFG